MIKKISFYIFLTVIFLGPAFSLAQPGTTNQPNTGTPVGVTIGNPTNAGNTIMQVLYALLDKVVMPIAAIAVVVWIIWAGFSYVTAQGNPAKIETAHKRLLWSLIGAGILLGAAGISKVVENTIGALINN